MSTLVARIAKGQNPWAIDRALLGIGCLVALRAPHPRDIKLIIEFLEEWIASGPVPADYVPEILELIVPLIERVDELSANRMAVIVTQWARDAGLKQLRVVGAAAPGSAVRRIVRILWGLDQDMAIGFLDGVGPTTAAVNLFERLGEMSGALRLQRRDVRMLVLGILKHLQDRRVAEIFREERKVVPALVSGTAVDLAYPFLEALPLTNSRSMVAQVMGMVRLIYLKDTESEALVGQFVIPLRTLMRIAVTSEKDVRRLVRARGSLVIGVEARLLGGIVEKASRLWPMALLIIGVMLLIQLPFGGMAVAERGVSSGAAGAILMGVGAGMTMLTVGAKPKIR